MTTHFDHIPLSDYSEAGYSGDRIIPCTAVQAGPSGCVSFAFTEIVNEPKNRNRYIRDKTPGSNWLAARWRSWDEFWGWNEDPPAFLIQMNLDSNSGPHVPYTIGTVGAEDRYLHVDHDSQHEAWVILQGYGGGLIPGTVFSVKVDGLPQGTWVRALLLKNPNYSYESSNTYYGGQSQWLAIGTGPGLSIPPIDIVREVKLTTSTDAD